MKYELIVDNVVLDNGVLSTKGNGIKDIKVEDSDKSFLLTFILDDNTERSFNISKGNNQGSSTEQYSLLDLTQIIKKEQKYVH